PLPPPPPGRPRGGFPGGGGPRRGGRVPLAGRPALPRGAPLPAPDGAILDVGRKTRTIPPALGRAVRARGRGCRFPGCTARRCDAHHVRHWADGGATRLDNLVLLCRRHHRAVHEEGFRVEVDPGGEVAFRWPDGRPFPAAPASPRWTGPALAPTDARLAVAGIAIGPATATPHWHGERLDLGYAIDVLWTPRAG
ncbi:MAG: HNH endonuclease signature motif containing protein, partial [Acidobacteria bacterium]|nr:HNH endonuclease signature motif containing protein [Acidobacteriota bacterium]